MKKRIIIFLLIAGILLAVLAPGAMAAGMTKYVYTRNSLPLNVRAWPSLNSALLGKIPNGTAVTVENYTTDYNWAVIRFNGQTAYVMTQYLVDGSPVDPTPAPVYPGGNAQTIISTMESEFRTYRVVNPYTVLVKPLRASGWVNLRYVPSTEMGHVEKMYANTQLTVIAETANWLQVRKNDTGVTGYVMREYTISMGVGSGY